VNRFGHFLEDRENLNRLIERIEMLCRERDAAAAPVDKAVA